MDFINKCINVISQICKVYLFNDGLTCMSMLLLCLPGMYWVWVCVELCDSSINIYVSPSLNKYTLHIHNITFIHLLMKSIFITDCICGHHTDWSQDKEKCHTAWHTLRLSTYQASTTVASTYRRVHHWINILYISVIWHLLIKSTFITDWIYGHHTDCFVRIVAKMILPHFIANRTILMF